MHKLASAIVYVALIGASSQVMAQKTPTAQAQPPMARKPGATSIVLVHGAWADGSSWDRVVPLLEKQGYNVVAVHLPLTSPAEDVAATNRAIERMPGDVVLVGHSYGGFVISEAGNNPKVKRLVFVDAFALDNGETVGALTKLAPPAWLKMLQVDSGGYAWLPMETVARDFAQDLPKGEQRLVYTKQGPLPTASFDVPMQTPAWKAKPSWYVRGTADRIIDPAAQLQMATRAGSKITSVDAGHVSMLSKPRQVADVILDAAASKQVERAPAAAKR